MLASNKGHAQPRGGKIGARLGERPNSTTVEGRLRIRKVGQRGEAVYVLSPLGPARRRFGPLNRFARFSFSFNFHITFLHTIYFYHILNFFASSLLFFNYIIFNTSYNAISCRKKILKTNLYLILSYRTGKKNISRINLREKLLYYLLYSRHLIFL